MISFPAFAGLASIEVQIDKPVHEVPPLLWGIYFEDINLSSDGSCAVGEHRPLNAVNRQYHENTHEAPMKVSPKEETFEVTGDSFARSFSGNSFSLIRIPSVKR